MFNNRIQSQILFASKLHDSRPSTIERGSIDNFDDIPKDHWCYPPLKKLIEKGVVAGFPAKDGEKIKYNGGKFANRYQLAAMIYRLAHQMEDGRFNGIIARGEYEKFKSDIGQRLQNIEDKLK